MSIHTLFQSHSGKVAAHCTQLRGMQMVLSLSNNLAILPWLCDSPLVVVRGKSPSPLCLCVCASIYPELQPSNYKNALMLSWGHTHTHTFRWGFVRVCVCTCVCHTALVWQLWSFKRNSNIKHAYSHIVSLKNALKTNASFHHEVPLNIAAALEAHLFFYSLHHEFLIGCSMFDEASEEYRHRGETWEGES